MTYYNEFDANAAQWLRNLADAGLIMPGKVDDRDVRGVIADEVREYTRCHFFAGIGGWDHALALAGWPAARPVWTASCPCQPFSTAGKGEGEADERHLWPVVSALVRQCRPHCLLGEQVASAAGYEWLDGVRADLEAEGYAFGAADLPACCAGAPHVRQRLFWVATLGHESHANGGRLRGERGRVEDSPRRRGRLSEGSGATGDTPDADRAGQRERREAVAAGAQLATAQRPRHPGDPAGALDPLPVLREPLVQRAFDARTRLPLSARRGVGDGPLLGFWDAYDVLDYRDGKRRRVGRISEPLVLGLADGLPPELAEMWFAMCNGFPLAEGVRGRTTLLRGYGNAIIPAVAAIFIKAFLESE